MDRAGLKLISKCGFSLNPQLSAGDNLKSCAKTCQTSGAKVAFNMTRVTNFNRETV